MKKFFSKIANRLFIGLIMVVMIIVLFLHKDKITMSRHYDFSTIAQASFGTDGSIILIDKGKTAIEILDEDYDLSEQIKGENEEGFYYAQNVLADGNTLYIADTVYYKNDRSRVKKRLLSLEEDDQKVLFEKEYNRLSDINSGNSDIMEIQLFQGRLYFLMNVDYGLELYRLSDIEGEDPVLLNRYYCGDRINDASIDLTSGKVAVAVKRGYIRVYDPENSSWNTLLLPDDHLLPNCVRIRQDIVYYTDLYRNCVFSCDMKTEDQQIVLLCESEPVSLDVSDNGMMLVSEAGGFYTAIDDKNTYTSGADNKSFYLTIRLQLMALIAIGCMLYFMYHILKRFRNLLNNENSVRVTIAVMAVAIVSCFVGYSLMDELFASEEETLIDNMKLFADLMTEQVDVSAIELMEGEDFYGTSAYKSLRRPLDNMIEMAFEDDKYYQYSVFEFYNDGLRYVLNFNDDVMCCEPYNVVDDSYYRKVIETGNSYALSTHDADGNWISILTPVTDKDNHNIAVFELSMDMSLRNKERNSAILNTVFNVFCTTVVVLMLILEAVSLLAFNENKSGLSEGESADLTLMIPLRTLIFFTNAADSMQDAFVAILCTDLYKGQLPLPDSVAVALPLSAQLLMLALFSSFMGTLGEKKGEAKVMGAGLLVQLAGCICCAATGTYYGVLIGKMFIGAGMGTVYVNSYAVAAKGKDEDSWAIAFTYICAGSLAGVTIGAGLSSIFLSIGGFKLVYGIAAGLLFAAFMVAATAGKTVSKAGIVEKKKVEDEPKGNFREFITSGPVLGYFLLILLPFMMSLAYREYFLPIVAGESNVSEVDISRFYLLCGVVFLYLGPGITAYLMKTIGLLKGVLLASALMAGAMLIYVIRPETGTVFFGMVILSFSTSFSYGCMYTYFGGLPQSQRYGETNSMQVYTVFESIGSTIGPVTYGLLLSFGKVQGLSIFGILMLTFAVIYAMIMMKNKKSRLSERREG